MILLDATKLRSFMQCPRRFYYAHCLHLEPAGSQKIDLLFGGLVHDALEKFTELAKNHEPEAALLRTLEEIKGPSCVLDDYDDSRKNRQSLFRVLIWYRDQFYEYNPVLETIRNEIPFRVSLAKLVSYYSLNEFAGELGLSRLSEQIWIGGRLDSLVRGPSHDEYWIKEIKTTVQSLSPFFFMRYSPEIQTSLYPMVARLIYPELRIRGVMLEAIQVGVNFVRFDRKEIVKWPDHAVETLRAILKSIAIMCNDGLLEDEVATDLDIDFNETGCMAGGGPCNFRNVCNAHPAARRDILRQSFVRREPWSPLSDLPDSEIITI